MTLIEVDNKLASVVTFEFASAPGGKMKFQFPPKITSDGRKADWEEVKMHGDQPLFFFILSGSREIRLEWTYIVGEGSNGSNGGAWTTQDVKDHVSGLRSYFSKVKHEGKAEELAILYNHWLHGGTDNMTVLMRGVDISHGKTIVMPDGDPKLAYPLRTDIGVDLRLWTNSGIDGTKEEVKQDLEKLRAAVPVGWI